MFSSCSQRLANLIHLIILAVHHCTAITTSPPLKPGYPFLFTWNAPTELCQSRFGINLDLSHFQLVSSTLKSATNQSISIFYTDRFGLFPYVDEETEKLYDEGLPQRIDFQEHRELAEDDILFYIPDNQPGLAVLDFEEWRPQWIRNWGSKEIYRDLSVKFIMQKNMSISFERAEDLAREVFERAAKKYFLRSLRLGQTLRPSRRWGYYLYPDCYNYDYNSDMDGFTGECPEIEKKRNNNLLWLWEQSTALFPSIYLEQALRESHKATLYVRHRIQEAMRVSRLPNSTRSIPIYAYIRPLFKDNDMVYMSEYDLVNTIGEAAALGAAGVISWGDMNITESEASCSRARRHLEKTMNRYILNVTTATQLCSKALCQSEGRCIRKIWDRSDYLHLDPQRYRIRFDNTGQLFVKGQLSQEDIDWFAKRFDCLCYSEQNCLSPLVLNAVSNFVHSDGSSSSPTPVLLILVASALWTAVLQV
ncbi:hyaluronidase-5-like [Chanos chanos]|uniref:Hyaluronidase n=1 Tax=Chanos chanos TaxID=29144 RepID=A0A6J2UQ54_CHACN|nr:hyaluronidase-5-like [Chanos chanos]